MLGTTSQGDCIEGIKDGMCARSKEDRELLLPVIEGRLSRSRFCAKYAVLNKNSGPSLVGLVDY